MSDKVVGYVCVGGMIAVIMSNLWMGRQVSELKTEVEAVKSEAINLKMDVSNLQEVVLYQSKETVAVSESEVQCLAKNIFHEAGVEDLYGKIAVAQVTLNRLRTGRWGNTICDVVYAKSQFSWTRVKAKRNSEPKGKLWADSLEVAHDVIYNGRRIRGLEVSGFYHTDYISTPDWAKGKQVAMSIGQHIFYYGNG